MRAAVWCDYALTPAEAKMLSVVAAGTPLHWAAGAGKVNTMEVLISLGADVDALSNSDATPLHQAVLRNRPEAVKLLIRSNADLNSQNKSGHTPLDYAKANGWTELATLLQEAGALSGKSL